jgi:cobalt-zinc-cadmium efflux system outer membrane protein
MKYILKIMTISFMVWPAAFSQTAESPLSLDSLMHELLQNNPQFSAMERSVAADKEKIPQSGSLPDPQLNIGLLNLPTDTYDLNQEAMTQKMIGISQKFPFFGKLNKRELITEKNYHIGKQYLSDLKLNLINQLEKSYYTLYAVRKFIAIMEENHLLLKDFVTITAKKYSSGKGIYQDVLKSQLEVLKVEKKLIELTQDKMSVQAHINALLNRDQKSTLGIVPDLPIPDIQLTFEDFQQLALKYNPKISAGKIAIDKSQLAHQLARRDYWPDLMLGLNYGQRENRPDFISGVVSINLPLYAGSKQARKVEESKLILHSATDQLQSLKNEISLQVKTTIDKINENKQLLILYRDGILPQARQALTSAIAAYQTGKVDFITLLNNQVSLLNYELDYYRLIKDYNISISDLNRICSIDTYKNRNEDVQ